MWWGINRSFLSNVLNQPWGTLIFLNLGSKSLTQFLKKSLKNTSPAREKHIQSFFLLFLLNPFKQKPGWILQLRITARIFVIYWGFFSTLYQIRLFVDQTTGCCLRPRLQQFLPRVKSVQTLDANHALAHFFLGCAC